MTPEHFNVLIVGAGLSGIGAAYHLQRRCPRRRYAILESRERLGGTWDLFRYPGVRSDSDMYTLGYAFRPWPDARTIADGASIRDYLRDTACEYGIDRRIRFRHRVVSAGWSSDTARWTLSVEHDGRELHLSCNFLYLCSGYYRYDRGHQPAFPGAERFTGRIVHPQHWPEDFDHSGKRVVVIGSGATAVTLVPALAERAAHVTMLQRSPSYVVSLPATDPIADRLLKVLPPRAAYVLARWKNVLLSLFFYQLCRRRPQLGKRWIRKGLRQWLPADYPIDVHFAPRYNPWEQRLCMVPDGDLFRAVREGRASIVTDHIDTFTEGGVKLKSGAELAADLIVTATGLKLLPCGGIRLAVDGAPVDLGGTVSYRGMMLSGVPNLAMALGYTNASWTLKAELTSRYVCRLLNYMDRRGLLIVTPREPPDAERVPLIDLNSGYVLRSLDELPQQAGRRPWRLYQNYLLDTLLLRFGSVDDGALEYASGAATQPLRDVA